MFFPLYVDLTEKNILFVGGGHIAARRVHTLLPFAKRLTVVAPEFEAFFYDLVRDGFADLFSQSGALHKEDPKRNREPGLVPLQAEKDTFVTEEAWEKHGNMMLIQRRFELADLEHRDLVFAATDDAALNEIIAQACRQCGIPVNVSTDQGLCDFQFPSVVMDGDVVIGVNASGKNHTLVKETRQKLERFLCTDETRYFQKI